MRLFIVFLVICCVGCTCSSRYIFTLKGELDGMKYGKAFLIAPGDSAKILYIAEVDGGRFEIKGELDEPGAYILKVNRRQFYFFMDGKNMEVTGDYLKLGSHSVKGSPANDLNEEYEIARKQYYSVRNKLINEYKEALDAGEQKLADEKMTEALKAGEIEYRLTKEFVEKYPDNMFSAYIADNVKGESYEKGKELYNLLSERNKLSYYGCLLKKHTDELAISALGVPCPDFMATEIKCHWIPRKEIF